MEKIATAKNAVLAAFAAAGSGVLWLFGGWDAALQVLVAFLAADHITGLLLAGVFRRSPKSATGALDSRIGFTGLMRKCAVLVVVLLAAMLDRVTGQALARSAVCLFFTANEGISILENLGLMGVPYPAFLRDMLEALRRQGDEGKDGK